VRQGGFIRQPGIAQQHSLVTGYGGAMSFFERPSADHSDDETADETFDEVLEPQSTYLGGVVPVEVLLAQSDAAAVALRSIVAFPDGFEFTLDVWVRHPVARQKRWPYRGTILLDASEVNDDEPLPDEFLRFGIQFPDGARISNLDRPAWELSPDATEPQHGMNSSSGGGSDLQYSQQWWAWPIPDSGTIAFVCEWPAYGIDETRVELDAALLREAANRAQPVWPDNHAGRTHWSSWELSRAIRRRLHTRNSEPDDA
jgi:hypothetical protein